jgi:hypothetical protein
MVEQEETISFEKSFELNVDWDLSKNNLYKYYRENCRREYDRLQKARKLPVRGFEAFVQYKFNKHQSSVLNYITRKGWLKEFLDSRGQSAPNISTEGRPKYVASPESKGLRMGTARKRGAMAPLWGYGPHDTELIMGGGANLNSTTHWKKAKYLRWMRVYRYCTVMVQGQLDIYNMADWAEASKTEDETSGHTSIWDVIQDTGVRSS